MLKYIIPRIALADLPSMTGVAVIGALVAGLYGILHDHVTYSISPEYFTKLKFVQFYYADFRLGDRVFVTTIGFLATWWVGFIIGWFLARRSIPGQPKAVAFRQIRNGSVCVFTFGVLAGLLGYAYGLWRGANADYSSWNWAFDELQITDRWAFVRVAYIHNASYFGGLIGLVVALATIRTSRTNS
jgi:hypothetical protein